MRVYDEPFERLRSDERAISYSVRFGKGVRVGHGVVIDPNCVIGDDVFIGHNTVIRDNVIIGKGSIIGHLVVIESDTEIGEHVTIQSQSHITKMAFIGDRVFMGPMSMCINTKHISHGREFKAKLQGPRFGFGARIGAGSIILPGSRIGANAMIGAGALVNGVVPENEKYISRSLVAKSRGVVPQGERLKNEKDD